MSRDLEQNGSDLACLGLHVTDLAKVISFLRALASFLFPVVAAQSCIPASLEALEEAALKEVLVSFTW